MANDYIRVNELRPGDRFIEDTFPYIYECVGPDPKVPGGVIAINLHTQVETSFVGNVCLVLLATSS